MFDRKKMFLKNFIQVLWLASTVIQSSFSQKHNSRPFWNQRQDRPLGLLNTRQESHPQSLPFQFESSPGLFSNRKLLLPIISQGYASTKFHGSGGNQPLNENTEHLDETDVKNQESEIISQHPEDSIATEEVGLNYTKEVIKYQDITTTSPIQKKDYTQTEKTPLDEPSLFDSIEGSKGVEIGVEVKTRPIKYSVPFGLASLEKKHKVQKNQDDLGYSVSIEEVPAHDSFNVMVKKPKFKAPTTFAEVVIPPEDKEVLNSTDNEGYYKPPKYNTDTELYQAGYQTEDATVKDVSIIEPSKVFHDERPQFKVKSTGPDYYPLGKPHVEPLPKHIIRKTVPVTTTESSSFFNLFNFFGSSESEPSTPAPKRLPPHRLRHPRPTVNRPLPQHSNNLNKKFPNNRLFQRRQQPPRRIKGSQRPLQMTSEPVIGLSRVPPVRQQAPFLKQSEFQPPALKPNTETEVKVQPVVNEKTIEEAINSDFKSISPTTEVHLVRSGTGQHKIQARPGFLYRKRKPSPPLRQSSSSNISGQIAALLRRYLSDTASQKLPVTGSTGAYSRTEPTISIGTADQTADVNPTEIIIIEGPPGKPSSNVAHSPRADDLLSEEDTEIVQVTANLLQTVDDFNQEESK